MSIPTVIQDALDDAAKSRHKKYADHPKDAPLVDDYLVLAMAGEWAFAEFSGLMPDLQERPKGDGGIDFVVPVLFTVDVKTVRDGNNLLHKVGKPFADIYVLAEYNDVTKKATLLGWTWGTVLQASKPHDFGRGYTNYHVSRDKLRPMHELARMMAHWQRQDKRR